MIYAFEGYELDTDLYELRRGGEPVGLEPQVFDVLAYLVAHRDRVVAKPELLDNVWGDRFVSESALSSRIKAARRAVGDDGATQRVIKTVHGRGYHLAADVREVARRRRSPARPAAAGEAGQEVRFCSGPDGVRLAYATAGDGPPLVKAANWLTHLRYDWESVVWRHWLRDLSAQHRLVHYDQRASGLSDWDVEDLAFETWVRDLEAVVDSVGLERFDLLGISQGGAVAVAYAARHPERVSHLILYGAFAEGRATRAKTAAQRREAAMMLDIIESGWGDPTSSFRQLNAAQFMPEGSTEQWNAFDAHQRLTASPQNARRVFAVSSDLDVTEIAPLVRTPTMVLHATDDRRVPYDQGALLAGLIPDAQLVPLEGSNHLLLDGEPAWSAFLAAVEAFTRA